MTRTLVLLTLAAVMPAAVPTPESHFGHPMGQDRTVLDWASVVSYFDKLAQTSDRVVVREAGKSTEGRSLIVAYIAAPETLKRLEYYRGIQKKLVDPRVTPESEAERLIAAGKTVVLITCSIHANRACLDTYGRGVRLQDGDRDSQKIKRSWTTSSCCWRRQSIQTVWTLLLSGTAKRSATL